MLVGGVIILAIDSFEDFTEKALPPPSERTAEALSIKLRSSRSTLRAL